MQCPEGKGQRPNKDIQTRHRKERPSNTNPHYKPRMNPGAPPRYAFDAPLVAPMNPRKSCYACCQKSTSTIFTLKFSPVYSGVPVARSLVFCVMFYRLLFVLFLLTIALSVFRFTVSDYPSGILIPFLQLDPKCILSDVWLGVLLVRTFYN